MKKIIYISKDHNKILSEYLIKKDYTIKIINPIKEVYPQIQNHPDVIMCKLGSYEKDAIYMGNSEKLGNKYPKTCLYNAASTGKFFICNVKNTDKDLLDKIRGNQEIIDVAQGYTKCNIVVVDENSIITSDKGIYNSCKDKLDVLLIEPGYINLSGFKYGFIGGCTLTLDNEVIFHGNLEIHPNFLDIISFIKQKNKEITYFKEFELLDIGSMYAILHT